VTYEGDNNVLIQQTSNWLLRQWDKVREGEEVASPYNTIYFLSNAADILKQKFTGRDLKDVINHNCK
jgi:acyl-CoA oxidase